MKLLLNTWGVVPMFLSICMYSHSQVPTQEQELAQVSSLQQIRLVYGEDWVVAHPDLVDAIENCLDTRLSYREEQLTADDKYPLLSSFPLMNKVNPAITEIDYSGFSPGTFNPLIYSLPYFDNKTNVIRVDGTNYIIVIEPVN